MNHNIFFHITRPLGISLLLWCFSPIFFSGQTNAQCIVYFVQCPGNQEIVDCNNDGEELITWSTPIAATLGGCSPVILTQIAGPLPGSMVPAPGVYTIMYEATAKGTLGGKSGKATCSFKVTIVKDITPPVFTVCPSDFTIYAGNDPFAIAQWQSPIATDNCGVVVKGDIPCNSELEIGSHVVTYSATDPSGNKTICSFVVTVMPGFAFNDQQWDRSSQVSDGNVPPVVALLPNPFSDHLMLRATRRMRTDATVLVYDLNGRVLLETQWNAGLSQLSINSDAIPSGIVIIKTIASDGSFSNIIRGVKL